MLKQCCCCVNLYVGSLLVVGLRLLSWLLILIAAIYVAVQIFSPYNGFIPFETKADIEQNAHVLFLIMVVALSGIALESLMAHGIYKNKVRYHRLWYFFTWFAILASIVLMINFILGILGIPSRPTTGRNFFFDALCVLFHIVFFFIPEYVFGPRLTPLLTAVMILVHILLPVFHAYCFYVVYSYLHSPSSVSGRYQSTSALNGASAPSLAGNTATINGKKPCGNLCQKCQLAAMESGGANGAREGVFLDSAYQAH